MDGSPLLKVGLVQTHLNQSLHHICSLKHLNCSLKKHTHNLLDSFNMTYIPPPSFYDIFPNEYLRWNLPAPAANSAGGAPAGTPRYGLQYPGGDGPSPALPTPAEATAFQVPAPVGRMFSTDSSTAPSSLSSQLPQIDPSLPPPTLSFQELAQLSAANLAGGALAGAPIYGLQYFGGGGLSTVLTTPAQAGAFQVPAPVEERTFSTDSSTASSTLSSQSPQTNSSLPPSMLSFQDLAQLSQIQGISLTAAAAAAADAPSTERKTKTRSVPARRRGPNRRAKGSGYYDMMVRLVLLTLEVPCIHAFVFSYTKRDLPEAVQKAIRQEYPDCCEIVKDKDPSTVQKHHFSKRHFNKIDPQYQPLLPAFTCPAFVGLDDDCTSAK